MDTARVPIPHRPLSYQARARRTDPATSHEAAASVTVLNETHVRILRLLDVWVGNATYPHGLTDEELLHIWADQYDEQISPSGLRSRRSELVRAGRVVDSGERGTTAAGRRCIVWRLADD